VQQPARHIVPLDHIIQIPVEVLLPVQTVNQDIIFQAGRTHVYSALLDNILHKLLHRAQHHALLDTVARMVILHLARLEHILFLGQLHVRPCKQATILVLQLTVKFNALLDTVAQMA
jgi:hypothetical protein